jgi:predicted RNase H-like nuclease
LARGEEPSWRRPPSGRPNVSALLDAATQLAGSAVDVVAIDMPMTRARVTITARRRADDAISSAFGKAGAGVHSPTKDRPGELGRAITQAFSDAGYRLRTKHGRDDSGRALIEVFPLAALVRLMNVDTRPAYKVAKLRRYWRDDPPPDPLARLLDEWRHIIDAVSKKLPGFALDVPARPVLKYAAELKPYEDCLDAVVCAWVGALFASGDAEAFGDDEAAIWVPRSSAMRS